MLDDPIDWMQWPAKSAHPPETIEHPALYHMLDVAAAAECLIEPFPFSSALKQALIALTGLHDLGKFSESFRNMLREGAPQFYRHWEVTEFLLYEADDRLAVWLGGIFDVRDIFYAAVAGHHGRPSGKDIIFEEDDFMDCVGAGKAPAQAVLDVFAELWPDASLDGLGKDEAVSLSWWLPGFCTVADWVGSNPDWFAPQAEVLLPQDYLVRARSIAHKAVKAAGLSGTRPNEEKLFDFPLRPLQAACEVLPLVEGPMLAILEDETGSGKTEAALLLAHRMVLVGKGRGMFFALPTMATADAMFARILAVAGRFFERPSLALAHGRAGLSEAFRAVVAQSRADTSADTDRHFSSTDWLADDRRRALLADIGVGTVDQAFLSLLPVRFQTLRQYGLSSKILIIDEAHQVGEGYEGVELVKLLARHHALGGSAIVLTATLPLSWREKLLATYGGTAASLAYPAITVAGGESITEFAPDDRPRKGAVRVELLGTAEEALSRLVQVQEKGAACLYIKNAVDDAIAAAEALRGRGIETCLLHARFALCDRKRIEKEVQARIGRDGKGRDGFVLVGTQVLESSLDLDADFMISDLAPVAALIQRAGRLWRHMDCRPASKRPVPEPVLYVLSPDPDDLKDEQWLSGTLDKGAWVYSLPEMWRTAHILQRIGRIDAPDGLRDLIEPVHGDDALETPEVLLKAEAELMGKSHGENSVAHQNIVNFGKSYREEGRGEDEATYPTRLGDESRLLVLARKTATGLIPWAEAEIGGEEALSDLWALSELSVRAKRLQGFDLPDQASPEIRAVKKDWPEWRQKLLTLCPVEDDGKICEGLRYEADTGLIFSSPP